jgi:hypothetical protein
MSESRARDNGSANRQADQIKEELMKAEQRAIFLFVALMFGSWPLPESARAADELQLQEGDVEVRNFAFQDGEHLPLLRLHYTALGTPQRDASGKISNAVLRNRQHWQELPDAHPRRLPVSAGPAAGCTALLRGAA